MTLMWNRYKGADVAIKKLKSQQMTKVQIDEFAREAAVMVGLRHPRIFMFLFFISKAL